MPAADREQVRAYAPGRVNLIGDHTDYTGGWVLPMAIDRGTTVELRRGGSSVELTSASEPEEFRAPLGLSREEAASTAGWGRYVAGVMAVLRPSAGGTGTVSSDLPIGAGLSSSSSLTVAAALALGFGGSALDLARLGQQAETLGSGVPGGIMDQLCSAAGVAGHALLIDCTNLTVDPVPLPPEAEVLVAHCGRPRTLVGSPYAERRAACEAAAGQIGPLRDASLADAESLADRVLRRRARHVVTENTRVLAAAEALGAADLAAVGSLMSASHASLRDDFEVSTPELDALVMQLEAVRGVFGARLTGAGFGGCVVALAEPGTLARIDPASLPGPIWLVHPSPGARVEGAG